MQKEATANGREVEFVVYADVELVHSAALTYLSKNFSSYCSSMKLLLLTEQEVAVIVKSAGHGQTSAESVAMLVVFYCDNNHKLTTSKVKALLELARWDLLDASNLDFIHSRRVLKSVDVSNFIHRQKLLKSNELTSFQIDLESLNCPLSARNIHQSDQEKSYHAANLGQQSQSTMVTARSPVIRANQPCNPISHFGLSAHDSSGSAPQNRYGSAEKVLSKDLSISVNVLARTICSPSLLINDSNTNESKDESEVTASSDEFIGWESGSERKVPLTGFRPSIRNLGSPTHMAVASSRNESSANRDIKAHFVNQVHCNEATSTGLARNAYQLDIKATCSMPASISQDKPKAVSNLGHEYSKIDYGKLFRATFDQSSHASALKTPQKTSCGKGTGELTIFEAHKSLEGSSPGLFESRATPINAETSRSNQKAELQTPLLSTPDKKGDFLPMNGNSAIKITPDHDCSSRFDGRELHQCRSMLSVPNKDQAPHISDITSSPLSILHPQTSHTNESDLLSNSIKAGPFGFLGKSLTLNVLIILLQKLGCSLIQLRSLKSQ